jgi:hypothetical protein
MNAADVSPTATSPSLKIALQSWQIPIFAWIVSRMIGSIGLVVTPTPEGKWFNAASVVTTENLFFNFKST